jgi:HPt (histidine-containing phosphotransfer) domain-containing protein
MPERKSAVPCSGSEIEQAVLDYDPYTEVRQHAVTIAGVLAANGALRRIYVTDEELETLLRAGKI